MIFRVQIIRAIGIVISTLFNILYSSITIAGNFQSKVYFENINLFTPLASAQIRFSDTRIDLRNINLISLLGNNEAKYSSILRYTNGSL